MQAVEVEKLSVANVGQHIPIGDQKRGVGSRFEQSDRSRGTQRGLLAQVIDSNLHAAAVTEIFLDHVTEIVNGQYKMPESLCPGPLDDVLQYRLAAHGQ